MSTIGSEMIKPAEFRSQVMKIQKDLTANNGPFMKSLCSGALPKEKVKLWAIEFFNFTRWMVTGCVTVPNAFHDRSEESLHAKLDNALGEFGFKEVNIHPFLALDLAYELGATWEEARDHIPLPTTIWYIRQRLGSKENALGAATNIIEADNQVTCSMVFDAMTTKYGVSAKAASYFDVHREADTDHTEEFLAILEEVCDTRVKQEEALAICRRTMLKRNVVFDGFMELVS